MNDYGPPTSHNLDPRNEPDDREWPALSDAEKRFALRQDCQDDPESLIEDFLVNEARAELAETKLRLLKASATELAAAVESALTWMTRARSPEELLAAVQAGIAELRKVRL